MIKIQDLFDLEHSMAKGFLERLTYPWEALADLSDWIVTTGKNLNPELYEERAEHVWVHKNSGSDAVGIFRRALHHRTAHAGASRGFYPRVGAGGRGLRGRQFGGA